MRENKPVVTGTAEEAAQHRLTPRELTVLTLLAETLTASAIARRLGISPRTVHHHVEHIYRKLHTTDRLSTVLRAQALGLLPGSLGPMDGEHFLGELRNEVARDERVR
jgi:DNA-binding NarL/FixJ family response regulator